MAQLIGPDWHTIAANLGGRRESARLAFRREASPLSRFNYPVMPRRAEAAGRALSLSKGRAHARVEVEAFRRRMPPAEILSAAKDPPAPFHLILSPVIPSEGDQAPARESESRDPCVFSLGAAAKGSFS